MKFADMLSFWKLKGMVRNEGHLYQNLIYDSNEKHKVCSVEVFVGGQHAKIIYRAEGNKLALVYADIFFSGTDFKYAKNDVDKVFIKNASVSDLCSHFVSRI